jgi:hypothetical protein
MGVSALLAIRQAIAAAKKDLGEDPKAWFNLRKFGSIFLDHFLSFGHFFLISGLLFESFC